MRAAALAFLLVFFALAAATPARASLFCEIPKAADGFVALRQGPSAGAREIARMRAGDEVQLLQGQQGQWVEVLHWRGDDRLNEKKTKDTRRGWAHRRYIKDCG